MNTYHSRRTQFLVLRLNLLRILVIYRFKVFLLRTQGVFLLLRNLYLRVRMFIRPSQTMPPSRIKTALEGLHEAAVDLRVRRFMCRRCRGEGYNRVDGECIRCDGTGFDPKPYETKPYHGEEP